MKIRKLKIRSFEGLQELETEPGQSINLITGKNGSGKTSLLEAIRAAFSNKGNRSMLVRNDDGEGLILFELDNGLSGEREVTKSGRTAGDVVLSSGDGSEVSSAQKFLNNLGLGFNFNPIEFLAKRDVEQTKILLEVMPVDISYPELFRLSGKKRLDGVNYTEHPLTALGQIRSALFEERKVLRKEAREVEGTVITLRSKVPDDFEPTQNNLTDIANTLSEINALKTQHNLHEKNKARCLNDIEQAEQKIIDLQERIIELNNTIVNINSMDDECMMQLSKLPNEDDIHNQIAQYEANQEIQQMLTRAEQEEQRAQELRDQAQLTHSLLTDVEQKPAEILAKSPVKIEGLSIVEGKIAINRLPISELSTGEQLKVATEIALATLGDLKVVLVDGLETLDEDNQQLLLSRLSKAGVQAFVTKVSDGELTIVTDYDEVPF